jgi:N-acetylglucosamine kinase-like BadF-type ATPase
MESSGKLIFSGNYGASNLLAGKEFETALSSAFKDLCVFLRQNNKEKAILYISSGFSGTFDENTTDRFLEVQKKACLGYDVTVESLEVISDALLALKVYFPSKPGLLLISGTGSVCFGHDAEGRIFTTGGFGYLLGDEGSGYWFGREAVKAALRSKFHYKEKSVIEELASAHFAIADIAEVYPLIYNAKAKEIISSASELVFNAALAGCPIAEKIIKKGASELAYLVRNCSNLIGGKSGYVVLHGSVFKQELLTDTIKKELSEQLNIYLSDKRIDLEAAKLLQEKYCNHKEA